MEEFKRKFLVNELLIYESESWTWSLRPEQATLGSGVLALKRPCEHFSDLNANEFADLQIMVKVIEDTLSRVFRYDKINYLMLMMVDSHVHFHVIPRYARSLDFLGERWEDSGWPGLPDLIGKGRLEIQKLNQICLGIKENLVTFKAEE